MDGEVDNPDHRKSLEGFCRGINDGNGASSSSFSVLCGLVIMLLCLETGGGREFLCETQI